MSYKEVIDWSKVKEGDPVEYNCRLYYFAGLDNTDKSQIFIKLKSYKHDDVEDTRYNSAYCRPLDKSCIKREVDWSKVPVDAKCKITVTSGKTRKRHFSHYDSVNNLVHCFYEGHSSFTCDLDVGAAQWNPDKVELVEDENLTKE